MSYFWGFFDAAFATEFIHMLGTGLWFHNGARLAIAVFLVLAWMFIGSLRFKE
jgi:hypothetical protein